MTHPDIRICFVGDSFVNGTGDESTLGWAGRLCAAANAKGWTVTYYNLGVRRETSGDIRRRWQVECESRLPETCDARVIFSFGVNDTTIEHGQQRVVLEDSCTNTQAILQAVRSKYQVLFVGPPPIADDEQNARTQVLSEALSRIASNCGIPYVETFSRLRANERYKREVKENDGAHPRSYGYSELAAITRSSPHWWFRD
jgi:acyl-CoA thioesterase I